MIHTTETPSGLCECGCGGKTNLAPQTIRARGIVKGQPRRFLPGHHHRVRPLKQTHTVRDCGYATECWVWLLHCDKDGYGLVSRGGRRLRAHRLFYEEAKGSIPEGLQLDHLCRNPPCVNPDHLEAVTGAENSRRGQNAILDILTVTEIRARHAAGTPTSELAKRFGIDRRHVWEVVTEKTWRGVAA